MRHLTRLAPRLHGMKRAGGLATVLLMLALSGVAQASTLKLDGTAVQYAGDTGDDTVTFDVDATDVLVTATTSSRAGVQASDGCVEVKRTPATDDFTCPLAGVTHIVAAGAEGDDAFVATSRVNLKVAFAGGIGSDRLLGGAGDDALGGGAGDDTLEGGDGDDTLDPLDGADTVRGGPGTDTITARDGTVDVVSCGDGADPPVIADREDDVAADCEYVDRPPPPSPPPAPEPPAPGPPASDPGGQGPPPAPADPAPVPSDPAPVPAAPAPAPAGAVEILAVGQGEGRLIVTVRARLAGTVTVEVLGPTSGALGSVSRTLSASRSGQKLAVDIAGTDLRALGREGRVPVTVAVRLVESGYASASAERAVLLVVRPLSRFRRTGRLRRGGFAANRISGTGRNDELYGDSGNDTVNGLGGDDRLSGGTGNDRLRGGAGNDEIDGDDGDDDIDGGPGDDVIIETRFGDDRIAGGDGDDFIVGGRGIDTISGGPGDDIIFGGSAPDTIDCGPGEDIAFVNLNSERSKLKGCETVLEEDDEISVPCSAGGTDGRETLLGTAGADVCRAGGGDDDVEGAGGNDLLYGDAGNDRIFGRFGDDRLYGGAGDDELEGGRGEDDLYGGAGNDQLNGGYDPDRLYGGPGADRLISRGGGKDFVDCGPGRDTAIVDRRDTVRGCEKVTRR